MMRRSGFLGAGRWAVFAGLLLCTTFPARGDSICDRSEDRLVARWRLDDRDLREIADSAGKNPGRPEGKLAPALGHVDGGLFFDGQTGFITVPRSPSLDLGACVAGDGKRAPTAPAGKAEGKPEEAPSPEACGFAIEAWIYTRAELAFRPIVDQRGGAEASAGVSFFLADGRLAFQMGDERGSSQWVSMASVADGLWHHVAVSVDRERNAGVLYVDARPVLAFETPAGDLAGDADLLLGGAVRPWPKLPPAPESGEPSSAAIEPPEFAGVQGLFRGVLDDVVVYQRAVSDKEVASHFGDGRRLDCNLRDGERGAADVGVVPDVAGECPPGSDYVTIYMDDEDHNNASWFSGWVGATSHQTTDHVNGTRFGFCRVNGSQFYNLGHSNVINWSTVQYSAGNAAVGAYTYSVLKLGSQCPNGSKEIFVHVDNEDHSNQNSSTGNISPNVSSGNAELYFCMFTPSSGASMSAFPQLGITYGVFGGRYAPPSGAAHHNYWLQTGIVHTDDEDNSNNNYQVYPGGYTTDDVFDFTAGVNSLNGGNTNFYLAKVKKKPCPNPCPTGGVFDGANCYMYGVPGNVPFLWAGNFYYGKVNDHPGSPCPHTVYDMLNGTSIAPGFDTANCYIASSNGGPNPFIWHGNYYISRSCLGCANPCPFGGTFDGANCYMFTWPGVTPFIWGGNAYYAPVWHPGGLCPHTAYNLANGTSATPWFDGANCVVFLGPGGGQLPFLWDNKYYLTPTCTP